MIHHDRNKIQTISSNYNRIHDIDSFYQLSTTKYQYKPKIRLNFNHIPQIEVVLFNMEKSYQNAPQKQIQKHGRAAIFDVYNKATSKNSPHIRAKLHKLWPLTRL